MCSTDVDLSHVQDILESLHKTCEVFYPQIFYPQIIERTFTWVNDCDSFINVQKGFLSTIVLEVVLIFT